MRLATLKDLIFVFSIFDFLARNRRKTKESIVGSWQRNIPLRSELLLQGKLKRSTYHNRHLKVEHNKKVMDLNHLIINHLVQIITVLKEERP